MAKNSKVGKSINWRVGDLVLYKYGSWTDQLEVEYAMGCIQKKDDEQITVIFWESGQDGKMVFSPQEVIEMRDHYLQFLKDPTNKKVVDF